LKGSAGAAPAVVALGDRVRLKQEIGKRP